MIVPYGKYYLYRHIRLDKNEPFYVGIGTKRGNGGTDFIRAYYRAFTTDSRTNYWSNITSKTDYNVDIILESDSKEFILSKEYEFIALYGRKDLRTGTLVNLNDGGGCPKNRSTLSINKTLATKRSRGNLGIAAKNLKEWMNSPNYKNSRARVIYMYSITGEFIKLFNSVQKCLDFLNIKGSANHIIKVCDTKRVYKNKYIFSWVDMGREININEYRIDKMFYKPVEQICPQSGSVINKFNSIADAARAMGMKLNNISEAIIENNKSCGYYWRKLNQKL